MTSIYKRKGRKGWTVAWLEPGGRLRQVSKRTQAAAKKLAAEIELADTDGLHADEMFATYAKSYWLETCAKPHISYGSYRTYEIALRLHLVPALGDLPLRRITRRHVLELLAALQAKGLTKLGVCSIHAVLRQILEEAKRGRIVRDNVAANLGLRGMRPHPRRAPRHHPGHDRRAAAGVPGRG